jgi:hypothetical protein
VVAHQGAQLDFNFAARGFLAEYQSPYGDDDQHQRGQRKQRVVSQRRTQTLA